MAEKKHKGKHVYTSQFSMGQLDFERFHEILKICDEYGMRYDAGERDAVVRYYAALRRFYVNIKSIVINTKEIDEKMEIVRKSIKRIAAATNKSSMDNEFHNVEKMIAELEEIVYKTKQMTGLGIEVNRYMSEKKKWERAVK